MYFIVLLHVFLYEVIQWNKTFLFSKSLKLIRDMLIIQTCIKYQYLHHTVLLCHFLRMTPCVILSLSHPFISIRIHLYLHWSSVCWQSVYCQCHWNPFRSCASIFLCRSVNRFFCLLCFVPLRAGISVHPRTESIVETSLVITIRLHIS